MTTPTKPRDLVVTKDEIRIANTPGVEPEAQQVQHNFKTAVPIGPKDGAAQGAGIPGVIQYDTTAGELALGAKAACVACRHWSRKDFREYVAKSVGPLSKAEDRQTIEGMKSRLAQAHGLENLGEAMKAMGICRVLNEIVKGWVGEDPRHYPVITEDIAGCPRYISAGASAEGVPNRVEITTPAQPLGLYRPLDLDAQKIGAKRYDAVLFDALGKGLK